MYSQVKEKRNCKMDNLLIIGGILMFSAVCWGWAFEMKGSTFTEEDIQKDIERNFK